MRFDVDRADAILRAFLHHDGDDVAARGGVELSVRADDAEIGVAVLQIEATNQLEIRSDAIRIVDVAGLDERQEVHFRRLHHADQTARGVDIVADEADFLHARLVALDDREDDVDAAVRQFDGAVGNLGGGAAGAAIDFLHARNVGFRNLRTEGGMGARAQFGLQILGLDLAVALDGDAIDLVAFGNANEDVAALAARGNRREPAALAQSLETLFDLLGACSREEGTDRLGVDARVPFHDDRGRSGSRKSEQRREHGDQKGRRFPNTAGGLHVKQVLVATIRRPERGANDIHKRMASTATPGPSNLLQGLPYPANAE